MRCFALLAFALLVSWPGLTPWPDDVGMPVGLYDGADDDAGVASVDADTPRVPPLPTAARERWEPEAAARRVPPARPLGSWLPRAPPSA